MINPQHITPISDEKLPSVEEALAYAQGYAEGLRDAKEQDAAQLILERDSLSARLGFEKALHQSAERQLETFKAYYADHLPKIANADKLTGREIFEACMSQRLLNDIREWDRRETAEVYAGEQWTGFIAGLSTAEKDKWERVAARLQAGGGA